MSEYRKQEQEPASDEITEVAPGVLRMQLPIDLPGLGHVNCYLLEDERGLAVVDPGLPGEESFTALGQRLGTAGYKIADVHTAVVTHSHPDHFGGVFRLREATDCALLTHHDFRSLIERRELDEGEPDSADLALASDEDLEELRERWSRPTPWGTKVMPPPVPILRQFLAMAPEDGRTAFSLPEPSVTVGDSDVVSLGRREWVALHTPGHTNDHLCLFDPADGTVLSGDHVLPTITPHISGMAAVEDPLEQFFESLRRMNDLDGVNVVLPAHGHPFADLGGRALEIIDHHQDRLDILREASTEIGGGTVEAYMQRLFKERSWGSMAESETFAHLQHLSVLGEAEVTTDDAGLQRFHF